MGQIYNSITGQMENLAGSNPEDQVDTSNLAKYYPKEYANWTDLQRARIVVPGLHSMDDVKKYYPRGFQDPSKVKYDKEFGFYWDDRNMKSKNPWQAKVAKYMPSAIMALGTMGMGSAVGPLAKAGFGAGIGAMRGLSEGKKPLNVLKNAAIGAGTAYAGHLAGQALGGGFQGQLANRFVKQIPSLANMYGGTQNVTGVSPGNVRMDQSYRPTIPTPNNYNFLQPRGR